MNNTTLLFIGALLVINQELYIWFNVRRDLHVHMFGKVLNYVNTQSMLFTPVDPVTLVSSVSIQETLYSSSIRLLPLETTYLHKLIFEIVLFAHKMHFKTGTFKIFNKN